MIVQHSAPAPTKPKMTAAQKKEALLSASAKLKSLGINLTPKQLDNMANGKSACASKSVVKSTKGDEKAVKKIEKKLAGPLAKSKNLSIAGIKKAMKVDNFKTLTLSGKVHTAPTKNAGLFPKAHLVGEHNSTLKKKTTSALALASTCFLMTVASALF